MSKFNFDKLAARFQQLKKELPIEIAADAVKFFNKSFTQHGFDDGGVKPWKEVNRRIPGTPEYKYPKNRGLGRRKSAILVRSGRLKAAVNNSAKKRTFEEILFEVESPYGRFHNEGAGHNPKRKFMGDSKTLRKIILNKIKLRMKGLK